MNVEIWSDVVCPWCYIGKRRFETALAAFAHRDDVDVVWRSFQLDPNAAATSDRDPIERLAAKYGISRADAEAAQAQRHRQRGDRGARLPPRQGAHRQHV